MYFFPFSLSIIPVGPSCTIWMEFLCCSTVSLPPSKPVWITSPWDTATPSHSVTTEWCSAGAWGQEVNSRTGTRRPGEAHSWWSPSGETESHGTLIALTLRNIASLHTSLMYTSFLTAHLTHYTSFPTAHLTHHTSFPTAHLTHHISFLTPHSSHLIPHCTPHSCTPHSPLHTSLDHHTSFPTAHLTHHSSHLIPHCTPHSSHLIPHSSLLTPHSSLLTTHRVECGGEFSVFVTDNGILMMCGRGDHGLQGHGDNNDCLKPKLVEDLLTQDVIQVHIHCTLSYCNAS